MRLGAAGKFTFLHNEVNTIEKIREQIEALVPEARIKIGHGQMGERELESVMRDFYHQRFNVLLCTTIIESGIDIPSANTIVINRADRFRVWLNCTNYVAESVGRTIKRMPTW